MVKKDHYDQIDNSNNQYAKLKKFRICNHAIALLSTRGHHSPRNKGKPPTALCFDTAFCMYLFYHFSIKKQSNVRYIFAQKNSMKIAKFNSTIHLYSGILFCTSGV